MTDQSLRKAAILIAALDHRTADSLLDQMSETQAALVRRAVMELDPVKPHEQQAVIRQFMQPDTTRGVSPEADDGVELHLSSQAEDGIPPRTPHATEAEPSDAPRLHSLPHLQHAEIGQLVTLLSREHPQTIAVVATQLPPERASQLLIHLPTSTQTDVLRRIGTLGKTDPQIVREVQETIDWRLSRWAPRHQKAGTGAVALRAILDATDRAHRPRLVEALARLDPSLAEQLRPGAESKPEDPRLGDPNHRARPRRDESAEPHNAHGASLHGRPHGAGPVSIQRHTDHPPGMGSAADESCTIRLEFADLDRLDNASLATVFAQADPEMALVALAGAGTGLVDRIAGQLPPRQARQLHRRMCQLGPIRLRDIEQAQQQLARLASQLCRRGTIQPPPKIRHWAAAA